MEHQTECVFSGYGFAVIAEAFFSTSHSHNKCAPESGAHAKNATADVLGTDGDFANVKQKTWPLMHFFIHLI